MNKGNSSQACNNGYAPGTILLGENSHQKWEGKDTTHWHLKAR